MIQLNANLEENKGLDDQGLLDDLGKNRSRSSSELSFTEQTRQYETHMESTERRETNFKRNSKR